MRARWGRWKFSVPEMFCLSFVGLVAATYAFGFTLDTAEFVWPQLPEPTVQVWWSGWDPDQRKHVAEDLMPLVTMPSPEWGIWLSLAEMDEARAVKLRHEAGADVKAHNQRKP